MGSGLAFGSNITAAERNGSAPTRAGRRNVALILLAAAAPAGCAPVGPDFIRPAAIVSPEYKEIKGWKVATPRASEPKGAWWKALREPELDRLEPVVAVSNQTVKADEANYREALAL